MTHFINLQQRFYPNFDYLKTTQNVRKSGFDGYHRMRWSVFCRYKTILGTGIKVGKNAFMDLYRDFAPLCHNEENPFLELSST